MSPMQTMGAWTREEIAHFEWSLCDENGAAPLSRTCRTFSTLEEGRDQLIKTGPARFLFWVKGTIKGLLKSGSMFNYE